MRAWRTEDLIKPTTSHSFMPLGVLVVALLLFQLARGIDSHDDDSRSCITLFNCPSQQYQYESKMDLIHDERKYLAWDDDFKLNDRATISQLLSELNNIWQHLNRQERALKNGEISGHPTEPSIDLAARNEEIQDSLRRLEIDIMEAEWIYEEAKAEVVQARIERELKKMKKIQAVLLQQKEEIEQKLEEGKRLGDDIRETSNLVFSTIYDISHPWQRLFELDDEMRDCLRNCWDPEGWFFPVDESKLEPWKKDIVAILNQHIRLDDFRPGGRRSAFPINKISELKPISSSKVGLKQESKIDPPVLNPKKTSFNEISSNLPPHKLSNGNSNAINSLEKLSTSLWKKGAAIVGAIVTSCAVGIGGLATWLRSKAQDQKVRFQQFMGKKIEEGTQSPLQAGEERSSHILRARSKSSLLPDNRHPRQWS
jgi:hypothetical protein